MKVKIEDIPYRADFIDPVKKDNEKKNILQTEGSVYFMPVTNTDVVIGEKYYIVLYGILPSGQRATVILKDVPCFFYVRVEPGENPDDFLRELKAILIDRRVYYKGAELKKAYRSNKFTVQPDNWICVHFHTIRQRKSALGFVQKMKINPGVVDSPTRITAYDDDGYLNYYYPMISRCSDINTAGWNKITSWTVATPVEREEVGAVGDIVIVTSIGPYARAPTDEIASEPWGQRDPKLMMSWDIETYSWSKVENEVPEAESNEWKMFMLCANFHWYHSTNTILKVCLVDHPLEVTDENYMTMADLVTMSNKTGTPLATLIEREGKGITVICGSQRGILEASIVLLDRMRPDLMTAFNSTKFDWPRVRELLRREKLLCKFEEAVSSKKHRGERNEEYVHDNLWAKDSVKISADETMDVLRLDAHGVVDTDMLPTFKKLYPRSEVTKQFSLNYFLSINGLPSKEDMPYKVMFAIYEEATAIADGSLLNSMTERRSEARAIELLDSMPADTTPEAIVFQALADVKDEVYKEFATIRDLNYKKMAAVAKYCTIDGYRCQQLQVTRSIILDAAEIANASAVSLFDGVWRANGRKIRQLVGIHSHFTKQYKYPIALSYKKPTNRKYKFEGAYVIPPKRGLNKRRPTTGVDFSSLYPSLMMAFNLSGETIIHEEEAEEAAQLMAAGYNLEPISFSGFIDEDKAPDQGQTRIFKGWVVRHNSVIVLGDKVNTPNHPRNGQEPLEREIMGVYGTIQRSLFSDRRVYKLQFVKLKHLIEKMAALSADGPTDWATDLTDKDFEGTGVKFTNVLENSKASGTSIEENLSFELNVVNAKQSAKKIFMNTFYGESGNFRSNIFDILVAGGITSKGRHSIQRVQAYLYSEGYDVPYGDTDSCYTCPPDHLFIAVDGAYERAMAVVNEKLAAESYIDHRTIPAETSSAIDEYLSGAYTNYLRDGKVSKDMSVEKEFETVNTAFADFMKTVIDVAVELDATSVGDSAIVLWSWIKYVVRHEYYRVLVQITRRDATRLVKRIGEMLLADNGTRFLNMDYEEVLFPCNMIGKKKYIGLAHHAEEVFYPARKDIFVKGIDVVKQGQTLLAREIGFDLIEKNLDIMSDKTMLELVIEKIGDMISRNWDLKYFILSKKYKPNKKNIPVLRFVERMKLLHAKYKVTKPELASLYEPPEAGDPFKYVVVKKETAFTVGGCKIALKVGDKMEYARVFEYMATTANPMKIDFEHYIDGALGGQLGRFIAYDASFQPPPGTSDDPDEIDEISCKAATKYVIGLCKADSTEAADLRKKGVELRSAAKSIKSNILSSLSKNYPTAYLLFEMMVDVPTDVQPWKRAEAIYNYLIAEAEHKSAQSAGSELYVETLKERVKKHPRAEHMLAFIRANSKGIATTMSLKRNRQTWLEDKAKVIKKEIMEKSEDLYIVFEEWKKRIDEAIMYERSEEGTENVEANEFSPADKDLIDTIYNRFMTLSGIGVCLRRYRGAAMHL